MIITDTLRNRLPHLTDVEIQNWIAEAEANTPVDRPTTVVETFCQGGHSWTTANGVRRCWRCLTLKG